MPQERELFSVSTLLFFAEKVSYIFRLMTVAIIRLLKKYKNEIFTTTLVVRDVEPYKRSVI